MSIQIIAMCGTSYSKGVTYFMGPGVDAVVRIHVHLKN